MSSPAADFIEALNANRETSDYGLLIAAIRDTIKDVSELLPTDRCVLALHAARTGMILKPATLQLINQELDAWLEANRQPKVAGIVQKLNRQ